MRLIATLAVVLLLAVPQTDSKLPDGFDLRRVHKYDAELVLGLCPRSQWDQVWFPCYEGDWADWAAKAQKSHLAALTPALQKQFHGMNLAIGTADGVLLFPDGSAHLVATASVDPGSPLVAARIFNPTKKTLDIVWCRGDYNTYMGPDARILGDGKVVCDMLYVDPGPAPGPSPDGSTSN